MIAFPKPEQTDQQPISEREKLRDACRRLRAALRRSRLLAEGWVLSKLVAVLVKVALRPLTGRLLSIWESLYGVDVATERLLGSLDKPASQPAEREATHG